MTPQSFSKKSPDVPSIPKRFGTWPMMMVSASPTMNPLSTGSEMNVARKPSRAKPAPMPMIPVTRARAAVVNAIGSSVPVATVAMMLAERAAVGDIGPTTRWRELPKAAYSNKAGTAA